MSSGSLLSRVGRTLLEWLGVALVSLLVAEVALRWIADVQPLTPGQFLFESHPTRGWTHRPGAEDRYVKLGTRQDIKINSLGLREREIPHARTPGVERILALGDSQVVGFEVAQDETFTRVAERELRARGFSVEVVNGGFRGYGTDQVLLFLREEGVHYAPDVVLYHWGFNDPQDNMTLHRPFRKFGKGYFDLDESGNLELKGTPVGTFPHASNRKVGDDGEVIELTVPATTRAMLWFRDLTVTRSSVATAAANILLVVPSFWQGLRGVAAYEDFEPEFDRTTRPFRLTAALIREMMAECERIGAEFRIVGARGEWGRALRDETGASDLGVVNRFRALIPEGAQLIVPFDSHMNALGHELFGKALAEGLVEARVLGGQTAD